MNKKNKQNTFSNLVFKFRKNILNFKYKKTIKLKGENLLQEENDGSKVFYNVSDEDRNTLFEKTNTKIGLYSNYILIFLIFFSILLVFVGSEKSIYDKYFFEIFIADFIISSIFLFEYLYRWQNSSNIFYFPFKFLNILDLLSFLPFFILIFIFGAGHYILFGLFRIFRIFRIFELIERIPIAIKVLHGINKHKLEYLSAIFLIFIILVIFSSTVYFIEFYFGDNEKFSSLSVSLWWGVVTMTTVGYGDLVPITLLGRLFGGILMFLGPVSISLLSAITLLIFLDSTRIIQLNNRDKICGKCYTKNDNNARYCDYCGEKLERTN